MSNLLNEIMLLVPPPITRHIGTAACKKQIELPDDYTSFIDIYGPGCFVEEDGGLVTSIHDLSSVHGFEESSWRMQMWKENIAENPHVYDIDNVGTKWFPEIPGIFIFGNDDEFLTYLWKTCQNVNDWTVGVIVRGISLEITQLSFQEFLYGSLARKFRNGEFMHTNAQPHVKRRMAYCPLDEPDYIYSSRLAWGPAC